MTHPAPRVTPFLPYLLLIGLWLLLHLCLMAFHSSPLFSGELAGPDSYMRLVRVTELLQGGEWFDTTSARSNAPFGETLHWTRPFDVLLIVLAAPLAALAGWHSALYWTGALVSPLLQLATGLVFIWASRPLLRPNRWFLPIIALFLQPAALAYAVPGRADHHVLLLLAFLGTLGFMLRALADSRDRQAPVMAGILAGFGLWLSVEQLLLMLACLVGFGLAWMLAPAQRARQGQAFSLALCATILLALLIERPPMSLLTVAYDRISVVHLSAAALSLAVWVLAVIYNEKLTRACPPWQRMAFLLLSGVVAALLLYRWFPAFFSGPMATVDPRILPIWLDRVTEMRAVLPVDRVSLGEFIYYFGSGLLAAPLIVAILLRERTDRHWLQWLFLAQAIALFWVVAALHIRFAPYAEMLFVLPLAELMDRTFERAERITSDLKRGLLRGGAISVLLVGSIGLGSLLMNADGEANAQNLETAADRCDVSDLANHLRTAGTTAAQRPLTILALLDFGPELLYRTHHRVIATPYHRNGDGIYDSHRILTSSDDIEARDMMAARGIELVLLCPRGLDPAFFSASDDADSLFNRLRAGVGPEWLQPQPLPGALAGQFQLFRVKY